MLSVETSGLHPTTASCLEALSWLSERACCKKTLEIGCGNGVLSAVAAAIWQGQVVAADIAEKALEDSRNHLAAQGLLTQVTLLRSDGFSNPKIHQQAPYDLIIGNLLAELQVRFAPHYRQHLSPDGHLLISGILEWKKEEIIMLYKDLGFSIVHQLTASPWHTLILRHATVT
jgi:ribosomal protein L11 methyltransferase